MGLFKRGHRVAEGGAYAAPGSEDNSSTQRSDAASRSAKAPADDLGLFGADSDESDDEATIDRYANKNGDADGEDGADEDAESKKVSVLLSKMTPEELFRRYDVDGSGNISLQEFLNMLPDLGIRMSEAKAVRIFKKCDTDGTGEIDLNEFKMAMFAVDPVSGNTLGFAPSTLLAPRDAFELFDEDGTGQIDELEFADVLEYFGMDVSDGKQEAIFKKYDKDKSGYIDYKEFRSMWIRLSNVREELEKRGVEIPKYATPWKLQRMLEAVLDEEEAKEATVMAEAKKFLEKQREKQRRERLGHNATVRAQDELAAALDAGGQVYVLGTGKYQQFTGQAVVRDEDYFPGFKVVSDIWGYRVDPKAEQQDKLGSIQPLPPSQKQQDPSEDTAAEKPQPTQSTKAPASSSPDPTKRASRYVRRRPENKRWTFHSPPKLNAQSLQALNRQVRVAKKENQEQQRSDREGEGSPSDTIDKTALPASTASEATTVSPLEADNGEDLARLFYEDREYVRSLRFRSTIIMKNTGSLWGRGVLQGAISDDVAFAVTSSGGVFTWGGKHKPKDSVIMQRVAVMNTDEEEGVTTDEGIEGGRDAASVVADSADGLVKVTPRSSMVKMTTKNQMEAIGRDMGLETREEEQREAERREQEDTRRYEQLKSVVIYYDVWEPPPSNATRVLFMEQVLLPRLLFERLQKSAQWRGYGELVERITKMELVLLLADCFELEREIKGESGHQEIKTQDNLVLEIEESKDKKIRLQLDLEKQKLLDMWSDLRALRESRRAKVEEDARIAEIERLQMTNTTYEAVLARREVQSEDLLSEYTARGQNPRLELSGITTRGPALHSPRGRVAVASISAGGSHAAIRMHNGSIFTWGIGSNGRLGHRQAYAGQRTFDSDHPQLLEALQDAHIRHVSCGYSHSAAVTAEGHLYAWGSTVEGKLGVGLVEDKYVQYSPEPLLVKFPGRRSISYVSCGTSHTGAVSSQGELFMWGSANGGRLGLGPDVKDAIVVPTLVKDFVTRKIRVWQVACGNAHSAACSETTSDFTSGSKKVQGGHVYVCGGAIQLGKHTPSWERVETLADKEVAIKQVSCGVSHTVAVSAYGELYTWGRNANGCTGHSVDRGFIAEPELVRSLHVEPYNLALGKPCRQMNVYNEQGPQLAVNGDVDGRLDKCIHTHLEEKAWWEVDLGQPAVIERIRVWNRTDVPTNPTKRKDEYTSRLFPFWILISEFPFKELEGKEGLRAAKVQSTAFQEFDEDRRMTEWVLPTAQTIGQYVRIQLQGHNFLHLAEVEVFGVYSAFNYVGRVGAAHAGNEATLVVVPPTPQQSALDDYYLRAIQADADNATILRQFEAFASSFRKFGRGSDQIFGDKCRLCRVFRDCELCEFYKQANVARFRDASSGALPTRPLGDRLGLSDLIKRTVDERNLDQEAQERDAQAAAARQAIADALKQAEEAAAEAAKKSAAPALLRKVLPGPIRKLTAAFPSKK